MRLFLVRLALCLPLAFSLHGLKAQVATGPYPYGSFDSLGIDTINVGNLNAHISIPVINKPGRGLPFYYNLSFDSSVWSPGVINGSPVWLLAPGAGWRGDTEIATGYVSYDTTSGTGGASSNITNGCSTVTRTNFVYHDIFGTNHYFGLSTFSISPPPGSTCGGTSRPNAKGTATDGSGYTLSVTNFNQVLLTARDGHTFVPPTNNTSGAGSISDLNGNQVSVSASGVFTDTLGKTALTVTNPSSSQEVLTYTDTNGNPQAVKVTYSTYTVQTKFGCSSLAEYGPISNQLISSISLADGSSYSITYEPTPGVSGSVTGRLASITQPQGGTISYQYTGGSNGINCADGSTTGLTRTVSGGKRTYVRSAITSTSSQTQTTDGLQNVTTSNFVFAGSPLAAYETQRKVYTGAASGTAQLSRQTCYNSATVPCTNSSLTLPISQIDTYQLADGMQEDGSTFKYNTYGLETERDDYDYGGSTTRGSLLRKEVWTYPSSGVVNLVSSDEVYDGSGNEASFVAYRYDETSVTATNGLPQHNGTVGSQRGNRTTSIQYASTGTSITTTSTYEDTGDVLTSTGPNGTSRYNYDPSTHAFVTAATPPTPSSGISLPIGLSNDANTGALWSTTDPNGKSVTYKNYDPLLRPQEIDNPDGGKTTLEYVANPAQVGQHVYQNASVYTDVEQQYDGYGRPSRYAIANGQSSNPYYEQDTCYDAAGNKAFVSSAYQSPGFSGSAVCSNTGTTLTYDGLGRVTLITYEDGKTKQFFYAGRATKIIDENQKARISQVDGLGRTASVCEVSGSAQAGGGTAASCGLDITGTGYLTSYGYTLATGTTTVNQGSQTRIFQTDWLGRTTSVQEPESGVTSYNYTYNSTGLVVTRKRPTANQTSASTFTTTTTQYDSIGRPVSVTYSDGTPTRSFAYDAASGWAEASQQTNLKGRLSSHSRTTAGGNTGSIFGYDTMGRVTTQYSCTPTGCGSAANDHGVGYGYNLAGSLISEGDGAGDTYSYTRSLAGEITGLTSSFSDANDPANIIVPASVSNSVFGPTTYQLGNELKAVYAYDSMGRNNGGWICNGSSTPYCTGGTSIYNYSSSYSGTLVTSACDGVLNACNSFNYDDFNRLQTTTLTQGSGPNLSFTYDRYGNRWSQTATSGMAPNPSYSFNQANNQTATYGYDALGNVTNDTFHSYTYDADNNVIAVDNGSTAKYYFDSLNQRVSVVRGGSGGSFEFVFNANGQRVSTWVAGTHALNEALIYGDNGPIAVRANGSTQFQHLDYLGTRRLNTDYTGAAVGFYQSLPFGDNYTGSGSYFDWYHFAGTDYDYESSTQHATFRQYSSTAGRWMSADSYYGSYDTGNPQSLNRYAYALNNVLAYADPLGLDVQDLSYGGGTDVYADDSNTWASFSDFGFGFASGFASGFGSGFVGLANQNAASKPVPCTTGFGAGLAAGVDAGAGGAVNGRGIGAAGNFGVGGGLFGGSNGIDAGGFASGGGAAVPGGTYPSPKLGRPSILGAAAGAGVGFFLTNASQASQLSGPSLTLNIDLGFFANGAGQLSFGTDNSGNSIWSFTFTAGYGFGGLFHGVTNQTAAGGVKKPCGK